MRWPVVGLLSFGMVIAYFDRVNLSVALPVMATGFGWNETQQGLAMSALFWTYMALQIPSGILVDRYGVRIPYLIGFLLWSIVSATTALTGALSVLIMIRLLVGVGESVVMPSSMRYIRFHFEEKQRGLAVGLFTTGTKIGPALGMPACAYLVAALGWRPMFLVVALVGFVWLIPWMAWVKKDDIAAVPRKRRTALDAASGAGRVSARQILRSPVIWGIIIGTYCYSYFVYYCMTWMPTYFKREHGMSIEETGWYGGVAFGGMAAVAAFSGWAADWFIGRGGDPITVRKVFTIAGFLLAATQTFGVFTDSRAVMLFFAVFSLCGLGLATPNYWALTQTLIPGGSIAMVVGIQNTASNAAGIVSPWLTGWMIDRTSSFDTPIKTIGLWLVLGIACYLVLVRRKFAPKGG
jgi:MFS family permease